MTISGKYKKIARKQARELYTLFPVIEMIHLHGSVVRGEATEKSDIDLKIYTELELDRQSRHEIAKMLKDTKPKIDISFCTKREVRKNTHAADIHFGRFPSELLTKH